MTAKQQPLGTCDHCLGPIPPGQWHTSKGRPRLHCSNECKNTANSRVGNPIRVAKLRERVAEGLWQNPAELHPPDPANVSAGLSRMRRAQVKRGTWRNPALDEAARAKLSRPRKHTGPLALAIEKLGQGLKIADLTEDEAQAHREWRASLLEARRTEANAKHRAWYRKKQAQLSDEEREKQRAKWREQNKGKSSA